MASSPGPGDAAATPVSRPGRSSIPTPLEAVGSHVVNDVVGHTQDLWSAYDAMNRQILADGARNGNAGDLGNINSAQGHIFSYDRNGNRIGDTTWGSQVASDYVLMTGTDGSGAETIYPGRYIGTPGINTQWYSYDAMNRLSTVATGAYAEVQTGTQQIQTGTDESGQPIYTANPVFTLEAQGRAQALVLDTRLYDGASREVQSGPNGSLPADYLTALLNGNTSDFSGASTTVSRYDSDGRLTSQHVTNEAAAIPTNVFDQVSETSSGSYDIAYTKTTTWTTQEQQQTGIDESGNPVFGTVNVVHTSTSSDYDAAGNVTAYRMTTQDNISTDYTVTQALYDGYKESGVAAVSTNNDSGNQTSGTTTDSYDVNGQLTGVTDSVNGANNRSFINDVSGHVLQKTQQGNVFKQLVVNGQVSATYGVGVNHDTPTDSSGNPNYSAQVNFDLATQPVTNSNPAAAPEQYPVQSGDTLQSIAQAVYGDSSLWYQIAQANGLSGNQDLRVGETLSIPTQVGATHKTSSTYAPYNPSRVVGSTTPNLPAPAGNDDSGCGGLGIIIMIVVAVVVAVFAPEALPALANAEAAGGATAVAGYAAAAALGSVASQVVGNAIGAEDGFSWKQVAIAALSAGITEGVDLTGIAGTVASATNATVGAIARAALSNALTQGISIAVGWQKSFSWMSVAAAGATAGFSQGIGDSLGTGNIGKFANGAISGIAGDLTAMAMTGGRISAANVVADAFGNALGSALAKDNYSGNGQQGAALNFAQDVAQRTAANPLLGYGGGIAPASTDGEVDNWSSQAMGGGDNPKSPTSTVTLTAEAPTSVDNRALLNANNQETMPGYYTSRRGYSYTVQAGDTLSGILNGDMTHVGLVSADNGLRGSTLREGQTIFIADKNQYGDQALASFGRYGQAIYSQDNARIAEMQQRAQLFASDDGSGSDYGMAHRAQESAPAVVTSRRAIAVAPEMSAVDSTAPYDEFGLFTMPGARPIWDAVINPIANAVQSTVRIGNAVVDDPTNAAIGLAKKVINFGPEAFNATVDAAKFIASGYVGLAEQAGVLNNGAQANFNATDAYHIAPLYKYNGDAQLGGSVIGDVGMMVGPAAAERIGQGALELGRWLAPAADSMMYNTGQRLGYISNIVQDTGISGAADGANELDAIIQRGGAHGEVRGLPGYESHHMPADSISPLPTNQGPAIAMEIDDHRLTASWGSSRDARAYRQEQATLIEQGNFKAAQQMDIQDVTEKFGSKYDEAIQKMLEYMNKKGY